CTCDLIGDFAAGVAALFVDSDTYTVHTLFHASNNRDIRNLTTSEGILANPCFDMILAFGEDGYPELASYLLKSRGTRGAETDSVQYEGVEGERDEVDWYSDPSARVLRKAVGFFRVIRNTTFHGGANSTDAPRTPGELSGGNLRKFQTVFKLQNTFGELLQTLHHDCDPSDALKDRILASWDALESLKVTFEESRVARRIASDFLHIERDEDALSMSRSVLKTLLATLEGPSPDPMLARLVLTSVAAQVPSSQRCATMEETLRNLTEDNFEETLESILNLIEASPGLRFEFYISILNLGGHCTLEQVNTGYASLLGDAGHDALLAMTSMPELGDRVMEEFDKCCHRRRAYFKSILQKKGTPRAIGYAAFLSALEGRSPVVSRVNTPTLVTKETPVSIPVSPVPSQHAMPTLTRVNPPCVSESEAVTPVEFTPPHQLPTPPSPPKHLPTGKREREREKPSPPEYASPTWDSVVPSPPSDPLSPPPPPEDISSPGSLFEYPSPKTPPQQLPSATVQPIYHSPASVQSYTAAPYTERDRVLDVLVSAVRACAERQVVEVSERGERFCLLADVGQYLKDKSIQRPLGRVFAQYGDTFIIINMGTPTCRIAIRKE
ncbi:hypothetical protein KIPB_006524, partial [Kipferlia bialata]